MLHGLMHIHHRKKKLESFPSKRPGMRLLDYVAFANGILGPAAVLPQLYQIVTTHQTSGISVIAWALLACSSIIWAFYGFAHKAWPLVMSAVFSFILHTCVALAAYFL